MPKDRKGVIINVFNNKGGVGKTTTVINLAVAMAKKKLKTLVVDVDIQANATDILSGKKPPQLSLPHLLLGKCSIDECIYETPFQGNLYYLPNSSDLLWIEPDLIKQGAEGFKVLRDKIRPYVQENFDICLIDNPPNHGTFVINSSHAADLAIIPTDSGSRHSMNGLEKTLSFISEIQEEGNPDLKFLRMLVTKVDRRTCIDRDYLEGIETNFPDKSFREHIPVNIDFKYAEDEGKTIFHYNNKAAGRKAYSKVADEIIDLLGW